jgi:RimJ/RimL family protein N-acetyltransferase
LPGFVSSKAELDPQTGLPIGSPVATFEAGWPDGKPLNGEAVRLEAFQPHIHGDALWDAVGGSHHAALWQYMSEGPFLTRDDFDTALFDASQRHDPVFFAIVEQATGLAVGRCSLLNIRPKHRVLEVGHLLFSPRLQRTRAATETLYLLASYSFDQLAYRRYEWKCNALNAKSRQAAERSGFIFEGIFRQHMIVKGRSRDSAWFSIVAEEWPGVKLGFEKWLAPENFDAAGNQRHKLLELINENRA